METLQAWLRLNRTHIPPKRQLALLDALGSPEAILSAPDHVLDGIEGLTQADRDKLRREANADVSADWEKLQESGTAIVGIGDERYPKNLREIPDPPPMLFVAGAIEKRDELGVGIVGTRAATAYGKLAAERLAADLARRGFTIVSGLARGIDQAAHEGALSVSGRTIGVLACGLDVDYPRGSRELKESTIGSGAVITECPFGTPPTPERFPTRNRIVSGLSLGIIVVEAPERSGALITADFALEQNREVFAVPGSIDTPTFRGSHQLIKDGAKLVDSVEDVIAGLGIVPEAIPESRQPPPKDLSADEGALMDKLSHEPKHLDALIQQTGLEAAKATSALMLLEVKGAIRRLPGSMFVRL